MVFGMKPRDPLLLEDCDVKGALLSVVLVGWLVNVSSNMLVYLRDGSARTIVRASTLRKKFADQTFYLTQSHFATPGQPVAALTQ